MSKDKRRTPVSNVDVEHCQRRITWQAITLALTVLLIAALPIRANAQDFNDVPENYWAYSFIQALAGNSVTVGCGNGNYCPDGEVTRAQMAVFLERGMRGNSYAPPAASGAVFADVGASDFAAGWIEQLAADGITAGCGNGNYCPNAPVTRAQMAVFLLRAKYGSDHTPPPASGNVFDDISAGSFAAAWIEQVADEGVTAGCGNGNYCPDAPVTRAQMAVFLVRTFDLSYPNTAPTILAIAPANNASDVPHAEVILVTFSEAINPDTFNGNTVSVTGPFGPIAGTFDVAGANATFTPSTPFGGIATIEVEIGSGIQDLFGASLSAPASTVFHTAPETDRWYKMTNNFRGPNNPLGLSDTNTCETIGAKAFASDLWQFRRVPGYGGYVLESLSVGDRLGLEGAAPDDGNPCLMTGFAGIPDAPFSGQQWTIEPFGSYQDEYWQRLKTRGYALDDNLLRTEGPFTGQLWQFNAWVGIFATAAIGESNAGSPFSLDCNNPNRVVGVDIRAGDNIDNIKVRCMTPEGAEFDAGSTGGGGGSLSVQNCPTGSVFAGFYGRSLSGLYVDQVGVMCRWPFHEPQRHGPLLGENGEGNAIVEAACPAPWRAFGVGGRSGLLVDHLYMRCHPPEKTFAATDSVGGSGGEPFSMTCPPGHAVAGFRGRAGDDIDQLRLGCRNSDLEETADSGSVGGNGGQDMGDDQMCYGTEVMVGIMARTRSIGDNVIDQLSVRCSQPGADIFDHGQGGGFAGLAQSGNPVQRLDCPAGMYVTAVSGRFGTLLDNIELHCSTR